MEVRTDGLLTGMLSLEITDETDIKSMIPDEYLSEFRGEYIDWLSMRDIEIEPY